MMARRALLTGLAGIAVVGGAWGTGAFRATMAGPLEYAIAGGGPPLMMIHGTGGGFDQGLLFAHGLRDAGFQIVAPSRFG